VTSNRSTHRIASRRITNNKIARVIIFQVERRRARRVYLSVACLARRAIVEKVNPCTTASGEKSTRSTSGKLDPPPEDALDAFDFFFFGAGASFFPPPPSLGNDNDGALNFGALGNDGALNFGALNVGIDGALNVGIDGALRTCFVFFGAAGFDLACCSANKSPARALESALAAPLATCATSTAAVAANGVVAIVIASAAAHARSAPFARAIAHAPRDERVVVRTGVVVALRAAIMSLGAVCLSETDGRVRLEEEVTSVRSRVDRTRRNVRVTNARVRVCGTSIEETSTPSTPSIATASTPSRSRRDDEPSTVGRERTRVPSPLVVLRGLVRESRPIKKTHTQTDRPRSRSFETQGRDGSWWHHP